MAKPEVWMAQAIKLSKRGFPAPNPHVGCVIVKGGKVVGEGFHAYAGGDHAEVVALKEAGAKARSADVYVTLEPCNHEGRTPPCTEALIAQGVKSVTYACSDPNPVAAGGGARLRKAGIKVHHGLLESKARKANEQFLVSAERNSPYIVAKAAMSLDGRIALSSGESQWISNERSRSEAHRLRAECGAVLVGAKTVLCDDPQLTARLKGVQNQPVRIVLDKENELTGKEKVFSEKGRCIHVVPQAKCEGQMKAKLTRAGGFDLPDLMAKLYQDGVRGVLIEGGAQTIGSFLEARLVDRLELFVAAKVLGGGRSWVEGVEVNQLAAAYGFAFQHVRQLSGDLWITAVPLGVE